MPVTPKTPYVVNEDGSVDILVYQGRTLRFNVTHAGLLDPTGYQARFAMKTTYAQADGDAIVEASTTAGTIVLTQLPASAGTLIAITVPDEDMEITDTKGKYDVVLENPSGQEDPVVVGSWTLWKRVTP